MNGVDHEDFVPDHSGSEWLCDCETGESALLLVKPSGRVVLCSSEGEQPQKTIRPGYNPLNFQHVSLIARMFSRAFVNHGARGDTSGLATVINALPHITFALPGSHVRLQFVPAAGEDAGAPGDDDRIDLSPFINAAPRGVKITWTDTLMWHIDADGKISERWQIPIPVKSRKPTVIVLIRN